MTRTLELKSAWSTIAVAGALLVLSAGATAATSSQVLEYYVVQSGRPANPASGQQLFTQSHGKDLTCASCHQPNPTLPGKHASTGKPIQALAPVANPSRLTDSAKVEKWLRRNCKDVLSRECSPAEKADVLAWLINQKDQH